MNQSVIRETSGRNEQATLKGLEDSQGVEYKRPEDEVRGAAAEPSLVSIEKDSNYI